MGEPVPRTEGKVKVKKLKNDKAAGKNEVPIEKMKSRVKLLID